jgi:hypothetical protein
MHQWIDEAQLKLGELHGLVEATWFRPSTTSVSNQPPASAQSQSQSASPSQSQSQAQSPGQGQEPPSPAAGVSALGR